MTQGKQIAYPSPLPTFEQDAKGRITQGVAQDTNKNGTAGRPCTYCESKEEYLAKATAYLERCKKGVNGKPIMPYIEELAMELNTIDENIVNWANKMIQGTEIREHPELFTIYSMVKMFQKFRLKQRALGRYNPTGALSLLRFDHGAMETEKRILAGDKDEPMKLEVEIIADKKPTENDV